MRHGILRSFNRKIVNRKSSTCDRGYILITLMLFVALMSIAALAVIPAIKQQIKRDREEVLQHRGTAYMRAIQHFYKKFGRYPNRIEDLENTNNIRFLRKRYTDPMNRDPETHKEKDFRLLHMQDINLYTGQANAGGFGLTGQPNQGQPFGQNPLQSQIGGQNQTNPLPVSHTGPNMNTQTATPGDNGDNSDNSGNSSDQNQGNSNNSNNANNPGAPPGASPTNPRNGNNPLVFGGGPILGVASMSKDKSIREFGDKYKHYNDWLFVYDPSADRGGLLKGPVVPTTGMRGGGMGTPAGTLATQSQGGASGIQPQNPLQQPQQQPQQQQPQQGPQTPQMPPDQEP